MAKLKPVVIGVVIVVALGVLGLYLKTGHVTIKNRSDAPLQRVTISVTSDGDRTQTKSTSGLAPGASTMLFYNVYSEYSLYVEAIDANGAVKKDHYGYVIDGWGVPWHTIEITPTTIVVDGEAGEG